MEDWHFQYKGTDGEDIRIALHKGFIFDGASIPRPLWAFLSPVGLLLILGLIQDYGCKYDQFWRNVDGEICPFDLNTGKKIWDIIFLRVANEVNGFSLIGYIAWLGIKLGGGFARKKTSRYRRIPDKT